MSRVNYDIAAMLCWRQWYHDNGPLFRYPASDASPQMKQSYDIFCTVERVIQRSNVEGRTFEEVCALDMIQRHMPMTCLAHARTRLANKVWSQQHQTFLDYGPAIPSIRSANCDVRQSLSDMGVEFGIADYPDTVDMQFGHGKPEDVDKKSFLYPFSLQVPGCLHILDWLIKHTVQVLPFWLLWQKDAKVLLQYLHGQNNREATQAVVIREYNDSHAKPSLLNALKGSVGRFAHWRWKTLGTATSGIERAEDVVAAVFSIVERGDQDIRIREKAVFLKLQQLATDKTLWDQGRALSLIVKPMMEFMSWIQGCVCHEEELKNGEEVRCALKGCKAKLLAAKVQAVVDELTETRDGLRPGSLGCVDIEPVKNALSFLIGNIISKFHWVNQPPFTIWKARGHQYRAKHVLF